MFTGLVEEVGLVRRLEITADGGRLVVGARKVLEGTRLGDSIAVSGACLTVVAIGGDEFTVDCMPETLSRTTAGKAVRGSEVNLERALVVGGRLGGHLVLGHVDAVAQVISVERRGIALQAQFSLPETIRSYVAEKGSIAVDGVSLTVVRVDEHTFEVGLIPHTVIETTLRSLRKGFWVNLEADMLARYLLRAVQVQTGVGAIPLSFSGGLTEELLREKGFVL
jgi:riboflavin synthase